MTEQDSFILFDFTYLILNLEVIRGNGDVISERNDANTLNNQRNYGKDKCLEIVQHYAQLLERCTHCSLVICSEKRHWGTSRQLERATVEEAKVDPRDILCWMVYDCVMEEYQHN